MHILEFCIVGFLSPISHNSKTVSNLSVAYSSAELQSVHARFWPLCLHACTYWNFYWWIFSSYLPRFRNCIKLVCNLFQCWVTECDAKSVTPRVWRLITNQTKLNYAQLRWSWFLSAKILKKLFLNLDIFLFLKLEIFVFWYIGNPKFAYTNRFIRKMPITSAEL